MKKVYTLPMIVAFFLLTVGLSAQNSSWSVYKDLAQVKIEQKLTTCSQGENQFEYTFLKLTNKTGQAINVTFRIEAYYNGACTTCSNDEYVVTFTVPANGSIEPSGCAFNGNNDRLAIFRKHLNRPNYSEFTKFELSSITIQ